MRKKKERESEKGENSNLRAGNEGRRELLIPGYLESCILIVFDWRTLGEEGVVDPGIFGVVYSYSI